MTRQFVKTLAMVQDNIMAHLLVGPAKACPVLAEVVMDV